MKRSPSCRAKLERMNRTLRHEEADRVPVSDFFWGSFLDRWRRDLGLPAGTDIYKYYDLDWIVTIPNMDPHITQFEVLEESDRHVVVRTGFGATIKKQFADPMPAFLGFETDSVEKMESFQFDDPWDGRRYFRAGDNQIAGVGDGFARNPPAWVETVREIHPDFPVYGSVCEGQEMLWRIIGSENVMLWIGLYPDELARFIERVGEFALHITKAQIKAADGGLDGMVSGEMSRIRVTSSSPPSTGADASGPSSNRSSTNATLTEFRSSITDAGTSGGSSRISSTSVSTPITLLRRRRAWTSLHSAGSTGTRSVSAEILMSSHGLTARRQRSRRWFSPG